MVISDWRQSQTNNNCLVGKFHKNRERHSARAALTGSSSCSFHSGQWRQAHSSPDLESAACPGQRRLCFSAPPCPWLSSLAEMQRQARSPASSGLYFLLLFTGAFRLEHAPASSLTTVKSDPLQPISTLLTWESAFRTGR